jgi:predicted O-methyltransferase YrrM
MNGVRPGNLSATALSDEIYRSRVVRDAAGNEHALIGEIDPIGADYLYRLISSDDSITRTLEVGCAFGLSSLHICEALRNRPNASHTIVDPLQHERWHSVGIAQLERVHIDFFDLIA